MDCRCSADKEIAALAGDGDDSCINREAFPPKSGAECLSHGFSLIWRAEVREVDGLQLFE